MLERLLKFSIQNRWLIVLFTVAVAVVGAFPLKRLPIDAVPDIHIRRSKPDQTGTGRRVGIPYGQHATTDPVEGDAYLV